MLKDKLGSQRGSVRWIPDTGQIVLVIFAIREMVQSCFLFILSYFGPECNKGFV